MTDENNQSTEDSTKVALWNPPVTPGPLFHYLNWKALGERNKAEKSLFLGIAVIIYMLISLVVVQLIDSWSGIKVAGIFIGIGIVGYLIWNIFIASKLSKYIKANNIHYEKRTIIASLGASLATLVIYTYLMFLAAMPSLEFQTIELVNDTLEKNYYAPSECIAVSFDKEIKDNVYKCTAYLENGKELKVNITDSLFEMKIYIPPR